MIATHPVSPDTITNRFVAQFFNFRRQDGNLFPTTSGLFKQASPLVDTPATSGSALFDPNAARSMIHALPEFNANAIIANRSSSATHTVDQPPPDFDLEMAQLQVAAERGDEAAFIAAKQLVDWSARSAQDFNRAIQCALAAGAFVAARNLAADGATRYPADAELVKAAHILAPPKVTVVHRPPDTTWKANREWILAHRLEYRGQWVALRNGELIAAAKSGRALFEKINHAKDVLVTTIF